MKKEKIRRYKKTELLELLIRLRRENDELRAELEEYKKKLEDKHIAIENAGSIADAAMQLSGIFEAAQAACAQYIENIEVRPGIEMGDVTQEPADAPEETVQLTGTEAQPEETAVVEDDFDQVLAECAELARQDR